jgi:hypothetical protein
MHKRPASDFDDENALHNACQRYLAPLDGNRQSRTSLQLDFVFDKE